MELEKIIAGIEADSLSGARKIIDLAEQEKKKLLDEAQKQRQETLSRCSKTTVEQMEQLAIREKARTDVEVKKTTLIQEKLILQKAFDAVLAHFEKLPENRKRAYYSALMTNVRSEMPTGMIHCRKGEEPLFSAFSQYKLGENIETIGGFTVESNDGTIMLDMRFENLLKDIWEKHIGEIAALLLDNGAKQ